MLSKSFAGPRLGDEAVHARRKEMKRIRAVLRLLRTVTGDALYRTANAGVRDAARPLTALRDSVVSVELCERSLKQKEAALYKIYVEPATGLLREELLAQRRNLSVKTLRAGEGRLRAIDARLASARPNVSELESVRRGMTQIFKKGRRAFARAQRDPTTENLHEWRKQAKYLLYQTELLQVPAGSKLRKVRRHSKKLGERLGDDHDLAVLQGKLEEFFNRGLLPTNGSARAIFNRQMDRWRQKLQKRSFKRGKRLYKYPPAKFAAAVAKSLSGRRVSGHRASFLRRASPLKIHSAPGNAVKSAISARTKAEADTTPN
jgi:CHAD domain-containing protein